MTTVRYNIKFRKSEKALGGIIGLTTPFVNIGDSTPDPRDDKNRFVDTTWKAIYFLKVFQVVLKSIHPGLVHQFP